MNKEKDLTIRLEPELKSKIQEKAKELKLNKMNYTKEQIRIGAEKAFILDLIVNRFSKGIVSYVADSFNLWDVITKILPTIKSEIMARDGKLVIRPDSGDPVDIICGLNTLPNPSFKSEAGYSCWDNPYNTEEEDTCHVISEAEHKGVIELLWDIFGGTINEQGYKVLDPHIGAIYGDSITPERQVQIYERLAAKGFAATNIVLGVGSFTYQYNTRDTLGFAAKGAWFEVKPPCTCSETEAIECSKTTSDGSGKCNHKQSYNIYKDPITDDGVKRSLKGLLQVKLVDNEYIVNQECSWEQEEDSELKTIYENGVFKNQVTLQDVRNNLIKI